MPAIHPARLKKQVAQLVNNFEQPDGFVRSLHQLMSYYAERIQRPGQSGEPTPLITAYKVRRPVLRQIQGALAPLAESKPEAAITLCDALWEEPYLEFRLLAASLIGHVPLTPPEAVVERIQSWLDGETEDRLVSALLTDGLARMRREDMELVLRLVEGWLQGKQIHHQRMGLHALHPMVADLNYENLPLFYRLIHPITLDTPPELRLDLLELLRALARRSPQETAYFLRHNLSHPESLEAAWILRQTLDDFPPDIQNDLRDAVRGMK